MNLKRNLLLIIILILSLTITACVGVGTEEAPDFTLTDLEGNEVTLSDYIGEKPIFIKFWDPTCISCVEAMPEFQETYNENKERSEFFMINVRTSLAQTKSFMEENGYDIPVLMDTSMEVAEEYLVSSVPKMIFIDLDGKQKFEYYGTWSQSEINGLLDREL
ncbi:TlpA family protein disulfide reductase [Fuchsiella alkaliacetigena]|uniref:TlpA family protein disulfide reductase n=1 Tax=Fuchsiella alkaliacetigena TaxID=957042 RepID=UPI00200A9C5E|nr:TlpA disulfide reductase family protein [Fuchsiella alkaliacetigena]MCK8824118.1 TlpA family protein disulfide reductase [Fuchsiella alkaliacetigena]